MEATATRRIQVHGGGRGDGGKGRAAGWGRGSTSRRSCVVVLSIAPILWVLKMSVVPKAELFASPPPILPQTLTLDSYATVFEDPIFVKGLLNSAIIAGASTGLALLLGAPAAYAFARLRFRLRTTIMTGILALAFFPAVAVIAPLFIEFRALELLNTYWAVIITDTVFVLPLTVWILTAFFRPASARPRGRCKGRRRDHPPGVPQGDPASRRARESRPRRSSPSSSPGTSSCSRTRSCSTPTTGRPPWRYRTSRRPTRSTTGPRPLQRS